MKNNSAVISIGIPIFNGESFIERTIKSLRNQTFENFEVILYDDCSKDKSLGILLDLIEDDSRFKVILGKMNIGNVPKIMKEIIFPYSNGEYFMYMSQDDFLDKNALECAIENLSRTNSEITIFDFVYYQTFTESKKNKWLLQSI
jgi:glycosyltransferase involved in cell wall biosynthesis